MDPFSVAPKMGPGTSMRFRYRTPNTLNYPSPFFDMASLFLPRTIKAHEAKAPANAPIGETGTAKYAERSRVGFRAYGHIQLAAKVERQSA